MTQHSDESELEKCTNTVEIWVGKDTKLVPTSHFKVEPLYQE